MCCEAVPRLPAPAARLRDDERGAQRADRAARDDDRPPPRCRSRPDHPRPGHTAAARSLRVQTLCARRSALVADRDRACARPRNRHGQSRVGARAHRRSDRDEAHAASATRCRRGGRRRQTAKGENWVQLDRVRSNTGLAVVEIEERDTGHSCPRAEPDLCSGRCHLALKGRGCTQIARRRGGLGDHRLLSIAEDEMKITIVLWAHERHRGGDAKHAALKRKTRGQLGRRGTADQVGDRRVAHRQQARAVLKRLDSPALDAAERPRVRRRNRPRAGREDKRGDPDRRKQQSAYCDTRGAGHGPRLHRSTPHSKRVPVIPRCARLSPKS
jgi:hypothetical protein